MFEEPVAKKFKLRKRGIWVPLLRSSKGSCRQFYKHVAPSGAMKVAIRVPRLP